MVLEFEVEYMCFGMEVIECVMGECLFGWYIGCDSFNMYCLVVEYGGFLYDFDNYGDDLLFWMDVEVLGGCMLL